MIKNLTAFLDELLPPVFADPPQDFDPWFFDYFARLQHPAERVRYARALAGDLRLARFDPRGRTVLDAGSGFGVTLLCFAHLGASPALGVEAFAPMAATAARLRHRRAPRLAAEVLRGSVHDLALAAGTVDFIYCNEAISHFLLPEAFLDEAARVLRPGGQLMVCDSNNAMNRRTVAHVHELWQRFELGPPGADVHGHKVGVPYTDRRRELIAKAMPDLSAEQHQRLAWGTFARHGDEVVSTARELLAAGRLPEAPPAIDRSPVDPDKGDVIENLMHPHRMAEGLRARGFRVRVAAHFGGARGPWVAAANRVLRAATPLTLPYARSVKWVATRL